MLIIGAYITNESVLGVECLPSSFSIIFIVIGHLNLAKLFRHCSSSPCLIA